MVCGGTIIMANPRIVLTAAHCLYGLVINSKQLFYQINFFFICISYLHDTIRARSVSVSLFKGSYGNIDVARYARIHRSYINEKAPVRVKQYLSLYLQM